MHTIIKSRNIKTRSLRHVSVHTGTIFKEPVLCLAKNYIYGSILVVYDVVNVMAAYQPVVRVCGNQQRRLLVTAHRHNRLVCCHHIDHVITDEDITINVVFS
jgi:hypothetical protein